MTDELSGAKFRVYRGSDEYVRIDWAEGSDVTPEDADEALSAIATLTGGQAVPVLVDMRGMRSIERAARQRFAQADVTTRTALYVESPLSRTVANFFLGIGKPGFTTRVFTDPDDAERWLFDDDDG